MATVQQANPEELMGFFHTLTDFARGFSYFGRGVLWLRAHPKYLVLLFLPIAGGLVFLVGGVTLFTAYDQLWLDHLMFARPDGLAGAALYYGMRSLLYLAMVVVTFLSAALLTNILAAPLYDLVSEAVEYDVTGQRPQRLGLAGYLRVIFVELKKVALILFVSILLLFIPGVNVISTLIAAFLVGWDFFDYPLARRGWSFRQRLALVSREFWCVLGFGLWLVIPFIQIVVMPLAVAGGTLLNLDALRKRELLTAYHRPKTRREKLHAAD